MSEGVVRDGRKGATTARRRLTPPAHLMRRAGLLLLLGLALTASSFAAVILSSFGALTAIWPTNAIALVALLRGPKDLGWRLGVIGVLYAGLVGAVMLAGAPPVAAMALSATNLVEIGVAVVLLFRFGLARADLTRPMPLIGFLLCAAVAGPAAGALLGAPMIASLGAQTFAEAWWDYFAADALGAIIIVPFGLVVTRRRLGALTARTDRLWAFALFAVLTAACFYLAPREGAALALLAPIIVVATLRFGVLGAASAVLWCGLLALALSLGGLGSAGPDATGAEIRAALFDLQLGLAVLPLATLPIAAVLAERDRALVAAAAAERARSAFLTNMSHEVRTPLNGVIGLAEALAARSADRPADRDLALTIRSSGETLQRLLGDVLDLARSESGEALLEPVAFDLKALALDLVDETRTKLHGRPVDVILDWPAGLCPLRHGPEPRLRRVLAHLLDNAAKVTAEGRIVLSVRETADRLTLSVQDTGPGFDPALLDQLCDAFHQADSSLTRALGGAGLGLAVARKLAEDADGDLQLSNADGGARVDVTLALPPALAQPAQPALEPAQPAPDLADRVPRILMAEDNPANRRVVELILQMAEVELVSVENGAEAVAAFQAAPFDAVLMDVQMPVMDGLSAVRELRRLEAASAAARTPILMLTAHALPEHRAASAAAGADAHLTKPVAAPVLLDALSRALAGEPMSCAA